MVFRKKWRGATSDKFTGTSAGIGRNREKCQDRCPMGPVLARDQQPEFINVAFGTRASMQNIPVDA
jgi:hypothetical protein